MDGAAAPVLVVGYGSDLRGDDAAGRRVAEALAALALPGVEVQVLHQLTPELAADCAGRRLVVFVDASVGSSEVAVEALVPRADGARTTHSLDPRGLLGLAALLDCAPEAAVAVHVPAFDLSLGTALSSATEAAIPQAVDRVAALCRDVAPPAGGHDPVDAG